MAVHLPTLDFDVFNGRMICDGQTTIKRAKGGQWIERPSALYLSLSPFLSLFVCTCVRVCVWLPNGPAKGTKRKIVLYWCVLQIMTNRTNQKETNNRIKLTKRNDCFILTSKGCYCMDLSSAMPQPSSIDHLDWSLECRQRKPTNSHQFLLLAPRE